MLNRLSKLLFHDKPPLQTKDIPIEIILLISRFLTILEIARFSRVDKYMYEAISSSNWEYELPKQYHFFSFSTWYDVENSETFKGTFHQLSKEMTYLKTKINAREYELKKELIKLNIFGEPNSADAADQMEAACIMGSCGCLCGCCLPGLWSTQFFIIPSTILGTLVGLGCFFQAYSEEEKRIEKSTHQSRSTREAPIRKRIADERKNIDQVKIKFFPPPCTLKNVDHEVKSNLIIRKYKI